MNAVSKDFDKADDDTREMDEDEMERVVGGAWAWALGLQLRAKYKRDFLKDGFQDADPPMG